MNKKTSHLKISHLIQARKIYLADGRYMIFYTFDESLSNSTANADVKPNPKTRSEATEEKNV